MDPNYVDTHLGLGWVYQQEKMYSEAIAELQRAVNLSNQHEVPLASLGQVLAESGRKQEAAQILEELQRRVASALHISLPSGLFRSASASVIRQSRP